MNNKIIIDELIVDPDRFFQVCTNEYYKPLGIVYNREDPDFNNHLVCTSFWTMMGEYYKWSINSDEEGNWPLTENIMGENDHPVSFYGKFEEWFHEMILPQVSRAKMKLNESKL